MSKVREKLSLNVINFQLCIICQGNQEEELIEKPNSHEKLLSAIEERSKYGDSRLTERWSALKTFSFEEIVEKGTWHRNCYQDTTHSGMLKRARERYERELSGANESRKKTSDNLKVFLRSIFLNKK